MPIFTKQPTTVFLKNGIEHQRSSLWRDSRIRDSSSLVEIGCDCLRALHSLASSSSSESELRDDTDDDDEDDDDVRRLSLTAMWSFSCSFSLFLTSLFPSPPSSSSSSSSSEYTSSAFNLFFSSRSLSSSAFCCSSSSAEIKLTSWNYMAKYQIHTKCSLTEQSFIKQNFKRSRDPNTPYLGLINVSCIHYYAPRSHDPHNANLQFVILRILDMAYLCTKIKDVPKIWRNTHRTRSDWWWSGQSRSLAMSLNRHDRHWNLTKIFGIRKPECPGSVVYLIICFAVLIELRLWQTRHTQSHSIYHASIAWHSNNYQCFSQLQKIARACRR